MGFAFKSDVAFIDATLPVLLPDPVANPTGSLLLWDFSSPFSDNSFIPSGVGSVENLVSTSALKMIPSASVVSLRALADNNFAAGEGLIELTPKKGLHVYVSQTLGASGHGFIINIPDAIKTYIMSNSGHDFYFSSWGKISRASTDSANAYSQFAITTSSINTSRLAAFKTTFNYPSTGDTNYIGRNTVGNFSALGNYYRSAGTHGWFGTVPTSIANILAYYQVGSRDVYSGLNANKSASAILYKMYIEDLTVSGRTYASVDAIDKALFDVAFGVGGRFYGDTFTNPTTLP